MGKTVRLSDAEQDAVRQKAIEINKLLVNAGLTPLKDSELVHKILQKAVPCAQLGDDGEIILKGI